MKNLKIKSRILLSFGIVVAFIMALAAVITVSNLSTNTNVKNMRAETQMLGMASTLAEDFGLIYSGFNVISLSFDSVRYNEIVAHVEECREIITDMNGLAKDYEVLSIFQSKLNEADAIISDWSKDISEIHALNVDLERLIEDANSSQKNLTDLSTAIFDYQMELSRDEAVQDIEQDARLRRVSRIEQGSDIANRLNSIGGLFEVMFKSLDISHIDADLAYFNETVAVLTEFRDGSALQFNIDTATAMLEALEVYRGNINTFTDRFSKRGALIQSGKASSQNAIATVGALLSDVEHSAISFADDASGNISRSLSNVVIVMVAVLIVSVLMAFYISGTISKPLSALTVFMTKAGSTGDIAATPEHTALMRSYSRYQDETGQCLSATTSFISHIANIASELENVAKGDLTTEIDLLSEKDTMGKALVTMVDSLNRMFTDINLSTAQVSSGAKQIADGSQALAQGSTQQASSVEQLSSSITEIAQNTKTNADMANKAAALAGTIKGNAEKGSQQMNEMTAAVKDINQASQSIQKVIKVIDDIAFQTNILALNAAVEAARAGQHGKGFAVVAEEVRSLASKSAEAAKDTGNLIANSMEKAELGSRIAGETAASLAEIVSGINESSQIVEEIARSSEEQSAGIAQINAGIDQVAHVVQQNSATAEESAAASEEMSGQSALLEELVAQFKLKDAGNRGVSRPALTGAGRQLAMPEKPSGDFGKY